MITLAIITSFGFLLCIAITPVFRRLAVWSDLVDRPDGKRKVHARSVPVAGGPAVFVSFSAVLCAMQLVPNPLSDHLAEHSSFLAGLLLSGLTICFVGLADDWFGLRARYKLLGQIVAVAVVMSAGLMVRTIRIFHWEMELGWLAIPFTAFWLLGAINSLNLLDGMDGLLCSIGAVISLSLAAMAVIGHQWTAACVAVALAGALIGFLCFNFPPASAFLGDSGSMLIGLIIGVLGIHSALKGPATIALTAPVVALTIPIFDTLAAIVRRKLTGRSVSSGDREHLHHCLLRRGFSNRFTLTLVSVACLATCTGALVSLAIKNEIFAAVSALAVVITLVATRLFGYAELRMVGDRILARGAGAPCRVPAIDGGLGAHHSMATTVVSNEPTADGGLPLSETVEEPLEQTGAPPAPSHWAVPSP